MKISNNFNKSLIMGFLLAASISAYAQDEKVICSEIKEVKMYFSGAEVTRTAKTALPKGTSLLIFDNIAEEIETSGIQVAAGNNADILSVSHFLNQQNKASENQLTRKLEDSLKLMRDLTNSVSVKNQVLKNEEQILRNNQSAVGQNNGVNTTELIKILELNRKRQYEIQIETYENNKVLNE
jgi:hypothetical protein